MMHERHTLPWQQLQKAIHQHILGLRINTDLSRGQLSIDSLIFVNLMLLYFADFSKC